MANFDEIYESFSRNIKNKIMNKEISSDSFKKNELNEYSIYHRLEVILDKSVEYAAESDKSRWIEDWETIFDYMRNIGFPYTFRMVSSSTGYWNNDVLIKDRLDDECKKIGISVDDLAIRGKEGYCALVGHEELICKRYLKNSYNRESDMFIHVFKHTNESFHENLKEFVDLFIKHIRNNVLNDEGIEKITNIVNSQYDDLMKIEGKDMNESFTKDIIKRIKGFGKNNISNIPEIDPFYSLIEDGMTNIRDIKGGNYTLLKNYRILRWYFDSMIGYSNGQIQLTWKIDIISCKDSDPINFSNDPVYGRRRKNISYDTKFDKKNYKILRSIYNRQRKGIKKNDVFYAEIYPYLNKISNKSMFKKGFIYQECDNIDDLSFYKAVMFCYRICKYVMKNLTNKEEKDAFMSYIKSKAKQ